MTYETNTSANYLAELAAEFFGNDTADEVRRMVEELDEATERDAARYELANNR